MKHNDLKYRALENCLQRIQAGANLEDVLEPYPQWADELRSLLETTQIAQKLAVDVLAPVEVQARSRARFLQAAQEIIPPALPRQSNLTWRFALIIGVFLMAVGVLGLSAVSVSAKALPGDALYPVKLVSERTRLILEQDPIQRLELERDFDEERIKELNELIQRSSQREVFFTGLLSQMAAKEWVVGSVRVIVPPNARIIGEVKPGFTIVVSGLLQKDGSVIAHRLQTREFELTGELQSMTDDLWILAGIEVSITPDTIIQGKPVLGNKIHVYVLQAEDGTLQVRLVEAEESDEEEYITLTQDVPGRLGSPEPPNEVQKTPEVEHTKEPEAEETKKPVETKEPRDTDEPTAEPTENGGDDETESTPKPEKTDEPHPTLKPGDD